MRVSHVQLEQKGLSTGSQPGFIFAICPTLKGVRTIIKYADDSVIVSLLDDNESSRGQSWISLCSGVRIHSDKTPDRYLE